MNIFVIYGSLNEKSINKGLAEAMTPLAPEGMRLEVVRVPDFPLYSQERENTYPADIQSFKEKIIAADGVIIVTPEYNRGMPAALKNAFDWVSRPDGTQPWRAKAVGVMGASSGSRGAVVAQYDVKRMMLYFGAHMMGQPEFYVDNSDKKIENCVLKDEKTKEYLRKYLAAFKAHVELLKK